MIWNYLLVLILMLAGSTAKEEDNSNEVSVTQPSINPNVNLRKALLKALIELENEDSNESPLSQDDPNRTVEKASASALSFYTNLEEGNNTTSTTTEPTTESSEPIIIFQKSQAVQHSPITTLEKEEIDPLNDAEQILTSASSSFTLPNANNFKPDIESRSINKGVSNLIQHEKQSTTEFVKTETTTTTAQPTSSTEESEAKAEEVQFFSAPLVAAFTVHQDEQGVPKKVESILRPQQRKQENENVLQNESKSSLSEQKQQQTNFEAKQSQIQQQQQQSLVQQQQQPLDQQQQSLIQQQQTISSQQSLIQQQQSLIQQQQSLVQQQPTVNPQLEFQQRQRLLEQEILRLNQNLKQQQLLNQQQQQILLRQQQERLRLINNARPFLPIVNPTFKEVNTNTNTEKNVQNPVNQFAQGLPTKPAQNFNSSPNSNKSGVNLVSSITYDPLIEAGKLPLNAQILPIKGPVNFYSPIVQTNGFQQFHSLPQITPLVTTLTPIPTVTHPQFILSNQQGKRVFRQELGTGNFVNNDFNRVPTFSIQKSVQPVQVAPQQVNPSFALVQPQFTGLTASPLSLPAQNHRFFRSNLESTFRAPPTNNYQLTNLLYNSGAFRNKEPEDINIISKVLALNHSGGGQYNGFNRFVGRK